MSSGKMTADAYEHAEHKLLHLKDLRSAVEL